MATHRRNTLVRSRTGCTVCRQRRIKCDETKPACHRCVAKSWSCEYPTPDIRAYGVRHSSGRGYITVENGSCSTLQVPTSLSDNAGLSAVESRALAYFMRYAAGDMYDYLDLDLWTVFIPQRITGVPVVRKAIVALSSAHWEFVSKADAASTFGETKLKLATKASVAYDAALSSLRRYIAESDSPSKADVSVVCIILICCELLRGQPNGAMAHLNNGTAIIKSWSENVETGGNRMAGKEDFEMLSKAFVALEIQAIAFDDGRTPILGSLGWPSDDYSVCEAHLSGRFSCISDAHNRLNDLINSAFVLQVEVGPYKNRQDVRLPEVLLEQWKLLRAACSNWFSALLELEIKLQLWSPAAMSTLSNQRRRVAVLRAQHLVLECLLMEDVCCGSDCEPTLESPFDMHGDAILRWASIAVERETPTYSSSTSHPRPGDIRPVFSLDLGAGPLLIVLAFKTTFPAVRKRVVDLLNRDRHVQGWYHMPSMAAVINNLSMSGQSSGSWFDGQRSASLESTTIAALESSGSPESFSLGSMQTMMVGML
jgi:hypothetical protein